jgi:hypothetical protein
MRTEWQEHIGIGERTIRPVGGTKRVFVEHEDGGVAGYHTYHASGRVDATVLARPIRTEHSKSEFKQLFGSLGEE